MERILIVLVLIAGFLWLRHRVRREGDQLHRNRAVIGTFLVLPALIFAQRWLFSWLEGRWTLHPFAALALEALSLAMTFFLVERIFFVRRPNEENDAAVEGPREP